MNGERDKEISRMLVPLGGVGQVVKSYVFCPVEHWPAQESLKGLYVEVEIPSLANGGISQVTKHISRRVQMLQLL